MTGRRWRHLKLSPYPVDATLLAAFQINIYPCGGMALAALVVSSLQCLLHLRLTQIFTYPCGWTALAAFQINKYTFETHLYSCGGTALAAFETNTYSCGRTALAAFETKIYSCGRTALAAFKVVTLTLVAGRHWRYLG